MYNQQIYRQIELKKEYFTKEISKLCNENKIKVVHYKYPRRSILINNAVEVDKYFDCYNIHNIFLNVPFTLPTILD
jgi:uncharacterized CHY-type Zn-finger protein